MKLTKKLIYKVERFDYTDQDSFEMAICSTLDVAHKVCKNLLKEDIIAKEAIKMELMEDNEWDFLDEENLEELKNLKIPPGKIGVIYNLDYETSICISPDEMIVEEDL